MFTSDRRRANAYCAAIVVLLTMLGQASASPSTRPAATEPSHASLTWDLSHPRTDADLGWPASMPDEIWFLKGPGVVALILPGDRRVEYRVDRITVRRDGHRIAAIGLDFAPEGLEATYERAKTFAKEWNFADLQKLEDWHADRVRDKGNGSGRICYLGNREESPAVRVRVGPAYDPQNPWWLSLSFGFPADNGGKSRPAAAKQN